MSSFVQSVFISCFLVLGLSAQSQAQVGLEGFSSGRYEVRKTKQRHPASEVDSPVVTDSDGLKVRTLKASELAVEEKKIKEAELAKSEAEKKAVEKQKSEMKNSKELKIQEELKSDAVSEAPQAPQIQEPSLKEQAESLFSSKAQDVYDFYREQVHPDDSRNNRVELDVSPVAVYIDSQSNYSYRAYQSFFNALKIRSNIWFTPRIGVTGQLMFSLAADVDSIGANKSRLPAKYEFSDLGMNFRTFFGVSRNSSAVEFSILYSEDKMTVPGDNTSRSRLKSSGIGAGLKIRIPTSANYSWIAGGSFFPRLQHAESATGAAVTSGSSAESVRFGVDIGGEWRFSRQNQVVWGIGANVEKNTFDGAAGSPDQSTGLTPSNVSVTNALYMFSLGYRWGH